VSTFGISNANDFFSQIVEPYHEAFLSDNASSAGALVAISMAYHLYEWANPTEEFSQAAFRRRYPARQDMVAYFESAKMLANGLKHFVPKDPAKPSQARAITKAGTGFSSGFSGAFARCLYVHVGAGKMIDDPHRTADGWISADDLLGKMIGFWRDEFAAGRLPDGSG
jgi:hypothetical protein